MRFLISMIVLLCGVACTAETPVTPTATATPVTRSVWGEIRTLATAEIHEAPAMAIQSGQAMLAWRGRDAVGVRHYATQADTPVPTILALDAFAPFDYHVLPATPGRFHMLWLDRTSDDTILYLQSAYITANAVAELGINSISSTQTYHYDAAPLPDGSVHLVWTAGLPDEPLLFSNQLDARGRIAVPAQLTDNAHHPALSIAADGKRYVFWQRDDLLYRGIINNNALIEENPVLEAPILNDGDRLISFRAALDNTHHYLFWQLIRADGSPEVWWTLSLIESSNWQPITRLSLFTAGTMPLENPGYNIGAVIQPASHPQPITWAAPLTGQHNPLAVAVSTPANNIGIALFQDGVLIGYQQVVENVTLLRAPALATNLDKHLYLTWSEMADDLRTQLQLTGTR